MSTTTTTFPITWQEVLDGQSVSDVRALEKQLRASTLRDKEKLRALVGSNYRDLLSTADQISELDRKTRDADSNISSLSQACKPPIDAFSSSALEDNSHVASQLRLLDQLLRAASKSIKDRSALLASRIFVISRLLHKHLDDQHGTSRALQWLQKRLIICRQRLLACIDGIFTNPNISLHSLVQATGAYCLTTGSTSSDASRHLQQLRMRRLSQQDTEPFKVSQLAQRCHYLVASVTTIKAVSGRSTLDLLNDLQKQPLMENYELLSTEVLQLSASRNILPRDILSFAPYFKRNTPTTSEISQTVKSWVGQAMKHLVGHIERSLENCRLMKALRIRRAVLECILPAYFSMSMESPVFALLRETLSSKITRTCEQEASGLLRLSENLRSIGRPPRRDAFWSSDLVRKVGNKQADNPLRTLRCSHLGIDDELRAFLDQLRRWSTRCSSARRKLDELTRIRWQDMLEEGDDDEEEVATDLVSSLCKRDPELWFSGFNDALRSACASFVADIEERVARIKKQDLDFTVIQASATLLRVIREAQHVLGTLVPSSRSESMSFSASQLQELLAQSVAQELFTQLERESEVTSDAKAPFIADDLPSPVLISVLQRLCKIMLNIGNIDLWTKDAVCRTKNVVFERVFSEDAKILCMHSKFDEYYVRNALGRGNEDSQESGDAIGRKAALCWKRTACLFGILDV